MLRPVIFGLSLLLAGSAAGATEPLYRIDLQAPASGAIVHDIRWTCAGASCSAPRTASSPDINVCTSAVRKLGRAVSFQANGRAFGDDELAKCNQAAK